MWTYSQKTGILRNSDGDGIAQGYAGHGEGLNNPAAQQAIDAGPLPRGLYSMGAPIDHPKCGKFSIPLWPHSGNEMFGRTGFYIHGDLIGHVGEHLASDGCVILPLDVRKEVWGSSDHVLEVTE